MSDKEERSVSPIGYFFRWVIFLLLSPLLLILLPITLILCLLFSKNTK